MLPVCQYNSVRCYSEMWLTGPRCEVALGRGFRDTVSFGVGGAVCVSRKVDNPGSLTTRCHNIEKQIPNLCCH